MRRCVSCGAETVSGESLCGHHITPEQSWAEVNRVFCDLLHRGIEPPPVELDIPLFEESEVCVTADFDVVAV